MHERERRLDPLVLEVGEELRELRGGEHALVHERARRQRRVVHDRATAPVAAATIDAIGDLVLAPLTDDEELAVERNAARAAGVVDEKMVEARDHAARGRADHRVVDRDRAPPEDAESLVTDDRLDARHGLLGVGRVRRQEGHADAVGTRGREIEARDRAEEAVGHLEEHPRAVAGVHLGARRTPVVEVAERAERGGDDVVAGAALHVDHEGHAAGVVLEPRVVEPVGVRDRAERHRPEGHRDRRVGTVGLRHLTSTVHRHDHLGDDPVQRDDAGPAATQPA